MKQNKSAGMCKGGWNKPSPLKNKLHIPDCECDCCLNISEHFNKTDIKSAVEWLKLQIVKKCTKHNDDGLVCDAEDYCLHCKDKFRTIDKAFEDVIKK